MILHDLVNSSFNNIIQKINFKYVEFVISKEAIKQMNKNCI